MAEASPYHPVAHNEPELAEGHRGDLMGGQAFTDMTSSGDKSNTSPTCSDGEDVPSPHHSGSEEAPHDLLSGSEEVTDAGQSGSEEVPARKRKSPLRSVESCEYPYIRMIRDRDTCWAQGSCMLKDGGCLLIDWFSNNIKRLNDQFEVVEYMELPGKPWSVCCNSTEAAVSLPDSQIIVIVNLQGEMKMLRKLWPGFECTSVACHQGVLYGAGREIDKSVVLHKFDWSSGERISETKLCKKRLMFTEKVVKDYPWQVAVSDEGDRVFITLGKSGWVILDGKGKVLKIKKEFFYTYGVCLGVEGCVFVSGLEEEHSVMFTVNQYKINGQFINSIVNSKQLKRCRPYSLSYYRDKSILIVTFYDSDDMGKFCLK